jgi:hypothetical protein
VSFADLSNLEPIPERAMGFPQLEAELFGKIRGAISGDPRSQQTRVGPSEIGTPCRRRLGYKFLGVQPVNNHTDAPWLPTIGTGVHMWLADQFMADNVTTGELRWLVEFRVDVGEIAGDTITGSCDLYDRATYTASTRRKAPATSTESRPTCTGVATPAGGCASTGSPCFSCPATPN